MAVYKEEKTNTWRVLYRYTDWNGERKQTQKRGFKTKREAQSWEREQLNKLGGDLDMIALILMELIRDLKEIGKSSAIIGLTRLLKKHQKMVLPSRDLLIKRKRAKTTQILQPKISSPFLLRVLSQILINIFK